MPEPSGPPMPLAWFDGTLATGLAEMSSDPAVLDSGGWWAVVGTFEGAWTFARFDHQTSAPLPSASWIGPDPDAWVSSLDRDRYQHVVAHIRDAIAAGDVYQVNACRVLTAPLPPDADIVGLASVLAQGNPAPYSGVLRIPGVEVATASPELFLSREVDWLVSGPIKGTARDAGDLQAKDVAENVMIVDLVRNDLSLVSRPGSVEVTDLCVVEAHPGLVHLVSRVRGHLRSGASWSDVLSATFPPGSVSGAPKSSALRLIAEHEPVPRGPYCGAVGFVDADRGIARLAVGIRTFWAEGRGASRRLSFGTGAGITWGSDPEREWRETELKARLLLQLASTGGVR